MGTSEVSQTEIAKDGKVPAARNCSFSSYFKTSEIGPSNSHSQSSKCHSLYSDLCRNLILNIFLYLNYLIERYSILLMNLLYGKNTFWSTMKKYQKISELWGKKFEFMGDNTFKYHFSCTDGRISVRINLLFYL